MVVLIVTAQSPRVTRPPSPDCGVSKVDSGERGGELIVHLFVHLAWLTPVP